MNAEAEMATADGLGGNPLTLDAVTESETVEAMRKWIADSGTVYAHCTYEQALELLSDAADQQIVRFIDRHYEGGVDAFLRDGEA